MDKLIVLMVVGAVLLLSATVAHEGRSRGLMAPALAIGGVFQK